MIAHVPHTYMTTALRALPVKTLLHANVNMTMSGE